MHPAAGIPSKQQGSALPVQRLVLLPAKAVGEAGAVQFGALAQQAGQFGVAQGLAAQQVSAVFMAGLVLVGATVFLAAGQGEQAMAEVMAKTHGGQGIQFARRREGEQVPQADQVQMGFGMLGGRVAEVRRQAFHTTGADVFPAGIRQQHAAAQLLQRLTQVMQQWNFNAANAPVPAWQIYRKELLTNAVACNEVKMRRPLALTP